MISNISFKEKKIHGCESQSSSSELLCSTCWEVVSLLFSSQSPHTADKNHVMLLRHTSVLTDKPAGWTFHVLLCVPFRWWLVLMMSTLSMMQNKNQPRCWLIREGGAGWWEEASPQRCPSLVQLGEGPGLGPGLAYIVEMFLYFSSLVGLIIYCMRCY